MKKAFLAILILGLGLLAACGNSNDVQPIRIGMTIDESNPVAGEAASRALAQAMEDFIGIPVEAVPDISYLIGIEAMRAGHLDIMLVSAFNYIRTSEVVDVELLVTLPLSTDAANYAAIITRADNEDIHTIEDLRGRSMAFVSPASTMGYIFPKYHLVSNLGLNPDLVMNPGYFFDTAMFSGGHETNVIGVEMGDFDAAAIGAMFIDNMYDRGIIESPDNFRIIARTPETPHPSYIIRTAIDPEITAQIREFFLQYSDPAYFAENWGNGDLRFTTPDIVGYEFVRSMVATLGLD